MNNKINSQSNPLVVKNKNFLDRQQKLMINNEWVEPASGKYIDVYDPASGNVVSQIAAGNEADVDNAVDAATEAFKNWSKATPLIRQSLLLRLADLMEQNAERLSEIESIDNGKSLIIARNGDVGSSVNFVRYMAGWATKIMGSTLDISAPHMPGAEFHAYVKKQPVGVVGAIVPWNFPLSMAIWKIAPALATGCTVVLKPAEQTSLSALILAELIIEAGFPAGAVNIVTGLGTEAGNSLVSHPDVNKVTFTGSVETGKIVGRTAVEQMKRFTLELGGKSPIIIRQDANIEAAIFGASMAIFFNQGQTCTAGSRLYIHKSIFDEVVSGVAKFAENINVQPGYDAACGMGPLVSAEQRDRVFGFIKSGIEEGAEVMTGGTQLDGNGYFIAPTVLKTKQNMKVVQEEIFGPVVCAMPFDDDDEVLRLANDTRYGLAASVWTQDLRSAHDLAANIQAGTVWVNCHNVFDPNLPFGGVKQSGIGRELGKASIDGYLEDKTVLMKLN
ncbi:MAG: aldehyde dehydrogenase family protein [Kordiimonadaceae bacterium]|jgi:phenylacetaldehyde dehydrogenase|nr:aldehyde dehydrogenase family protein [Kordiimonadaceae bacterium]MBT6033245.1 aldehyde dehydrogenase family protein [Kordiimonadaceae bacterium]MBT6330444.1 aldehyde dehydrogenase family protein [Kordiimonadaceae bacterium]MBT7583301.1 aldehyde dehydrogenase family protein [Kordiimonadaceae bacterium]